MLQQLGRRATFKVRAPEQPVCLHTGEAGRSEAATVGTLQMLSMRSVQIGLLLFMFQQFAGINAIVYFSTSVFREVMQQVQRPNYCG